MAETVRSADRHAARKAAVQMLYQWEVGGADLDEVFGTYAALQPTPLDEGSRVFAETLVHGTAVNCARIDALITEQTRNWRIERMPVVDRLVLRVAIFELLECDTPTAVVIDEALELARTFSTEDAVKFINGVLDAVGQRLRAGKDDLNTSAP